MGDEHFITQLKHVQLMRILTYFELWLAFLVAGMFLAIDPTKTLFFGVCTFLLLHYFISRRKQSHLEESMKIPGHSVTIGI
jgi:hypothetical protein